MIGRTIFLFSIIGIVLIHTQIMGPQEVGFTNFAGEQYDSDSNGGSNTDNGNTDNGNSNGNGNNNGNTQDSGPIKTLFGSGGNFIAPLDD